MNVINHGQFELQLTILLSMMKAYPRIIWIMILTDNPLNDSMIEEIKSIPGVTDVMTRDCSVNLNENK